MQRPVMNPSFFEEAPGGTPVRFKVLRRLARIPWRVLRAVVRLLMYDPFLHIRGFRVEEGTPTSRTVRAIMYRVAFAPILLAALACGIVWTSTHPYSVSAEIDPSFLAIYYEPVTFVGSDKTRLEGWLVPVLEARAILDEQDKALRRKSPAVVLVHDFGQRREQMLPMIKPLHDAGFVVMAINLRGGGNRAVRGETFGLHEAGDIKAAVELLRKRAFVDPARVAVVGSGTGGNAALLAALSDPQICAAVSEQPVRDSHDLMKQHIMPQNVWLAWLSPLCKWTFEISYGVDVEELEMKNFRKLFESRPVLLVDRNIGQNVDPSDPKTILQITTFLSSNMKAKDVVAEAR